MITLNDLQQTKANPVEYQAEMIPQVQFRCPHCYKLYYTESDQYQAGDIYECIKCHQDFKAEALDQANQTTTRLKNCLKCDYLKPALLDECPQCGVFESKYTVIQKAESPRLFQAQKLWEEILSDFNQDGLHQKFLNHCQQNSSLSFAAKKYHDLAKVIGQDEKIDLYLQQIDLRLQHALRGQQNNFINYNKNSNRAELLTRNNIYLFLGFSIMLFVLIRVLNFF